MRVNIYAEELSNRVELIEMEVEGQKFTAVRFWLELPVTIPSMVDPTGRLQVGGAFIHSEGDDDSSVVTFWGKRELLPLLEKAVSLLRDYYNFSEPIAANPQAKQ